MRERPTGVVTFLFTDIEGSTARWERHPDLMPRAFALHEAILREAIAAHGGYAYKMVGDGFQAAFQAAPAALAGALAAQRALAAADWEAIGPIRVRMALHSAATEERGDDYVGPALNLLERMLAAGHGGQVLLTEAAAALARPALPPEVALRDLGRRRLKDLARPERLFQVVAPGLPARYPRLRGEDPPHDALEPQRRFGHLLRRSRRRAGLTQKQLAARVNLSGRAISDLERGVNGRPSRAMVRLLGHALELAPRDQRALEAAARVLDDPAPPAEAPTETAPPHNLPSTMTAFFGRDRELAGVAALLEQPGVRLVTLTGPAGVGKTRLALQVAAGLLPELAGGVYFVDLAALSDPAAIVPAVAAALGVKDAPGRALNDQLKAVLRRRPLLLVLDNFEHLLAGAPLVAEWLAAAPQLRVLTTSRRRLRLDAEREFPVPAFDLAGCFPDGVVFVDLAGCATREQVALALAASLRLREFPGRPLAAQAQEALARRRLLLVLENLDPAAPEAALLPVLSGPASQAAALAVSAAGLHLYQPGPPELAAAPGVALFVARAQAAQPGFAATPAHLLAAAALVSRLDGLPLAIELAAARLRQFGPASLLRHIERRLSLLTGGERDRPARHQTLRALIDWSYDLLDPPQQAVFARAAVFVGGWSVAAAEAVCSGAEAPAETAPAQLRRLAEHHLVREAPGPDGEPRFGWLETLREYALEKLGARGEAAETRTRHASYFAALADAAYAQMEGPHSTDWRNRLRPEYDNLQAALAWARDHGAAELGWRLGRALGPLWHYLGHISVGRAQLARLLAPVPAGAEPDGAQALADALFEAGDLALDQDEYAVAGPLMERSLALYRGLGDQAGVARALRRLGAIRRLEGAYAAAQAYLEQSLAICRALGDRSLICRASISLAVLLKNQANYAAARPLLEETLQLALDLGDRGAIANAHTNLAWIDLAEQAYPAGRRHCDASLAIYREHGSQGAIANMLLALSYFDQAEGDYEAARRRLAEALRILQETGDQTGRAGCLDAFACLALAQDQIPRAARLWAAAAALRARHHIVRAPADEQAFAEYAATARARVAAAVWDAAWAAGQALTPDETAAYALEETQPEAVRSGA